MGANSPSIAADRALFSGREAFLCHAVGYGNHEERVRSFGVPEWKNGMITESCQRLLKGYVQAAFGNYRSPYIWPLLFSHQPLPRRRESSSKAKVKVEGAISSVSVS